MSPGPQFDNRGNFSATLAAINAAHGGSDPLGPPPGLPLPDTPPDDSAASKKALNRLSMRVGNFSGKLRDKLKKKGGDEDGGDGDDLGQLDSPAAGGSLNLDNQFLRALQMQLKAEASPRQQHQDEESLKSEEGGGGFSARVKGGLSNLRKKLGDSSSAVELEHSPTPVVVLGGSPGGGDRGSGGFGSINSGGLGSSGSGVVLVGPASKGMDSGLSSSPKPGFLGVGLVGMSSEPLLDTIPSPPPQPKKPETPFERRTKIANEILETERTYLSSLQKLIEVYQQPLMDLATLMCVENAKFTQENVAKIFSTLPQIIPLNQELLNRLEDVMQTWNENSKMGEVFKVLAPFLKMYMDYENRYDTALATYTLLMKDPAFAARVAELDQKVEVRVEGCLIMPIQRIPRYKLLLEDMIKHTPPEHPDHEPLKQALAKIDEVAMRIDKGLQEYEQQQRLIEISSARSFQGTTLLAAHRKLLREGELAPAAGVGGKIHLMIFNDIIVPFPKSKLGKLGVTWSNIAAARNNQWPLELVWLRDDPSQDTKNNYRFELMGPSKTYLLKLATPEEKAGWLRDIRSAMESAKNVIEDPVNKPLAERRRGSYQFRNGVFYEGDWRSGMIDGKGVMNLYGTSYEGDFVENKKTGRGKMIYATGEIYEGEWRDDTQNGQGTMTWPTGAEYVGQWKDGKRCGKGEMHHVNGDHYSGNWEDNVPHGQGTLITASGVNYTGNWKLGRFDGRGTLTLPVGKWYQGDWVDGRRNGLGVYKQWLPTDYSVILEEYQGEYVNNLRHGQGTLTNANGIYSGPFVNDKPEGQGTMKYADGSVYVGSWKRGIREGVGTFTAASGFALKYEGEWKDDNRSGKGKLTLSDGSVYEGQFKKGKMHGNGVFTFLTGERYEGKWRHGMRLGLGTLTLRSEQADTPQTEAEKKTVISGLFQEPLLQAKKVTIPLAPPLVSLQFDELL